MLLLLIYINSIVILPGFLPSIIFRMADVSCDWA